MNDLISRQAAIDALEKVAELFPWRVPGNRDTYDRYNEAWNDAIGRAEIEIEELPSAQPEPHWIPCSERLPEVYKDVLICWDFKGNREVLIGNMYSDGTFHGYDDEYLTHNGRKYRKAVAWMPLPEPYREERTEE